MTAKAEIREDNGCWSIFVDGRVITPMAFTSVSQEISPDYLQDLGKAGIKLFFLVCDLPWLKQPGLDIVSLEHRFNELQKAVPGAKVILRVNLHPPLWWMDENPDELVRLGDNKLLRTNVLSYYYKYENMPIYSLVSKKWRYDAGNELKKLIALVSKMPVGDSVIGYFMAAGATGEWIQRGNGQDVDHGKAFKQHFSDWLHRKYKNKEILRHAWKRSDIDFNSIRIPSLEERSGHYNGGRCNCDQFDEAIKHGECEYAIGGFINPETSRAGLDFLLALHHGIAESIEYFCRTAKEYSNGDLLTGAFHGAMLQAGTRKILLESKYIDFLATPGNYINRKPGEITDIRCPSDSYALNNKMFIMEDDTRTYLSAPAVQERYKSRTLADSITQMKRDFGRNLCRNLYGWWFDMYIPPTQAEMTASSGAEWYNSTEILELIKKQQQIAESALTRDCRRVSSIAVIMDESSTLLGTHLYYEKAALWRCSELARIGTPLDFYYHDDLDNPKMPDYKLYIFLNVFMLNNEERQRINQKIKKNNATVLWMHASGVCNQDAQKTFSSTNIEDLTGIKMRYDSQSIDTNFNITMPDHRIIKGCDSNLSHGRIMRDVLFNQLDEVEPANEPNDQMPNFYPEGDADILGYFSANKAPALACRDFQTWQSIYCSAPFIGADLLRAIAENAGCHVVCDSDDFIFMNNSYLMIHAASDGAKTLSMSKPCTPVELYTDQNYGENIFCFTVEMKYGETLIFRI